MSSFYGIWHRDGTPVSKELASKMQEQFDWWQPDESDYIHQNNLLIGQATLWNTPESKHEHLPLQKDSYILAMDARIDNREELTKELDLPSKPLERIGDSEFILAAYRKWGEECADRLLGDFAFVIWDEKKEHLFCARDFIGVRPFYYYIDETYQSIRKQIQEHIR
jgi:asparagine synthase (glutamine-hydrolysing)